MRKEILLFVFTVISLSAIAQNFEGKIVYHNTYKSKLPNVPDEQFNSMMGTTQEYLIKGGNYKSTMNGTFLQWQLYLNKDNRLYTKMANSEAIFYTDGAVNPDAVVKTEINKGATEILGYVCDELVVTTKSGIQRFYFSPKIKIDSKLFQQHKFGNWAEILAKINSLPLKMILDTPQFTAESVATVIGESKLDDKIFDLPANATIQKSPF
jgi:hypothetical protein